MTRSTPSAFSLFRDLGSRLTAFRFSPFEISFAILAAVALMLSPQAAFAQRAGGRAGGGGHIGGGGGHFSGAAGPPVSAQGAISTPARAHRHRFTYSADPAAGLPPLPLAVLNIRPR